MVVAFNPRASGGPFSASSVSLHLLRVEPTGLLPSSIEEPPKAVFSFLCTRTPRQLRAVFSQLLTVQEVGGTARWPGSQSLSVLRVKTSRKKAGQGPLQGCRGLIAGQDVSILGFCMVTLSNLSGVTL